MLHARTVLLAAIVMLQASEILCDFDFKNVMCIKCYYPIGSAPRLAVLSGSLAGSTWEEMDELCHVTYPGYSLSTLAQQPAASEQALCPAGSLVPLGASRLFDVGQWLAADKLKKQVETTQPQPPEAGSSVEHTALRWPDTQPIAVGGETRFSCAVCELSDRLDAVTQGVYPAHDNADYAYDLQLLSHDLVDSVDSVAPGTALAARLIDDLALSLEVPAQALSWHAAELDAEGKAVVHVYYNPGPGDKMDWFHYLHWNDAFLTRKSVHNFELTLIKLNTECLLNKRYLQNAQRVPILTGDLDVSLDIVQGIIRIRECHWDNRSEERGAVWSEDTLWGITWEYCSYTPEFVFKLLKMRGRELTLAIRNIELQLAYSFQSVVLCEKYFKLQKIVDVANFMLILHMEDRNKSSVGGFLRYSIPKSLAKLFMQLPIRDGQLSELVHAKHVTVLVASRQPDDPVVGLALTLANGFNNNTPCAVQLNAGNVTSSLTDTHLVLTVSDSIAASADRLALAAAAAHLDFPDQPSPDASLGSWMAIVQVTFTRTESLVGDLAGDFVDVAFKPAFRSPTQRGKCAEWTDATGEWLEDKCRILKSPRDTMMVCRCTKPYTESNISIGTYIIYGYDASLSTYLDNNQTLVIVIAFVSLMSVLGLLSVILVAVFFPEWRKDPGHQIFLQMVLALTANLILGFVNNFVSVDTKTVACIAIGVVRHYSFLAMFFWMMILSGLQVKRLTTITGSKATTHLILKVSAIAWGLPLVPIVTLLAWDTGFYKSEVSNRGYCYPEGVAFQATVQAPAGIILGANLGIFVVILNHIYGWLKCGNEVEVRKHTADDRAAALRRLGTSIFVFFLFGFTWTFHFLSEEGVINSEFLFEFMFLITASFHLFMLSLFFIVLNKNTRSLWMNALKARFKVKVKSKLVRKIKK